MFNQYFGNYILEKKIITPEQLRVVLEMQKSIKVKLGIIAIDAGYMSAAEVNRVHKLQATRDKKFGELAIDEGYMTKKNVDDLLNAQKNSNVLLGQALIENGYLTFEKYEEVLFQYNEDSGFTSEELKALKNNDIDKIVEMFLKQVSPPDYNMYSDYLNLFIRNVIRFIDNEIIIKQAKEIETYEFNHFVTQRLEGEHAFFTGISGSESAMARFAEIYAKEECAGMDGMAKDSLSEFMNCQNGLFLSNLSHKGIELELFPSEVRLEGTLRPLNKLYVISCCLSFGQIDILFSNVLPIFE